MPTWPDPCIPKTTPPLQTFPSFWLWDTLQIPSQVLAPFIVIWEGQVGSKAPVPPWLRFANSKIGFEDYQARFLKYKTPAGQHSFQNAYQDKKSLDHNKRIPCNPLGNLTICISLLANGAVSEKPKVMKPLYLYWDCFPNVFLQK